MSASLSRGLSPELNYGFVPAGLPYLKKVTVEPPTTAEQSERASVEL